MKVTIDITREEVRTLTTLVQALQGAIGVETPRKLTKKKHIELLAKKMANGHLLNKEELETLNN